MSKIVLGLKPTEMDALHKLAEEQEMTYDRVLVQALRLYQQHNERLAAGETQSWSGDAERARAFAGDILSPSHSTFEHQKKFEEYVAILEEVVLSLTFVDNYGLVANIFLEDVDLSKHSPVLRELHEKRGQAEGSRMACREDQRGD